MLLIIVRGVPQYWGPSTLPVVPPSSVLKRASYFSGRTDYTTTSCCAAGSDLAGWAVPSYHGRTQCSTPVGATTESDPPTISASPAPVGATTKLDPPVASAPPPDWAQPWHPPWWHPSVPPPHWARLTASASTVGVLTRPVSPRATGSAGVPCTQPADRLTPRHPVALPTPSTALP